MHHIQFLTFLAFGFISTSLSSKYILVQLQGNQKMKHKSLQSKQSSTTWLSPEKYMVDCTERNFLDSVDYCTANGGTIASFQSDVDINEAKDKVTCNVYIGATSDGNGNWKWIDNSPWWAYENNDGLPGTTETKIVWRAVDNKWNDWGTGDDLMGVICKSPDPTTIATETTTTTGAPTPGPAECGTIPSSRIVGGSTVAKNSIPWQVGLVLFGRGPIICGGTLLTVKHVLTAAHCTCIDKFSNRSVTPSDILVVVAEHDQFDPADGTTHTVSKFNCHPSYDWKTLDNDFSMLFLSTNVVLGKIAFPACLPPLSYAGDALVGQQVKVSGWGSTTQRLVFSSTTTGPSQIQEKPALLQSVDVPVVSQAACTAAYANILKTVHVTDNMICAGIIGTGGKDFCKGDSGGPLTYENAGKTYLIGVVSWNLGCADPKYPGVYARVTNVLDWIQEQFKQ